MKFFNDFNNDSLALTGLILISLFSLFFKQESISAASVGAVGGFIGSRNFNNVDNLNIKGDNDYIGGN